jgi:hypothetical protein
MTNVTDLTQTLEVLREQIASSLKKAQTQKNTLQRYQARYSIANLTLSLLGSWR